MYCVRCRMEMSLHDKRCSFCGQQYQSSSQTERLDEVENSQQLWALEESSESSSTKVLREERLRVGDVIFLGRIEFDAYCGGRFKANIPWRVVDVTEQRILLVSKNIIEYRPLNFEGDNADWSSSNLRAWLNGSFFEALPQALREALLPIGDDYVSIPGYAFQPYGLRELRRPVEWTFSGSGGDYAAHDREHRWFQFASGNASNSAQSKTVHLFAGSPKKGKAQPCGVRPLVAVDAEADLPFSFIPVGRDTEDKRAREVVRKASVGDIVGFGPVSLFQYEGGCRTVDLHWRVIVKSQGKALLLAQEFVDIRPFDAVKKSRTRQGQRSTWQYSTLREWLGGAFYYALPEGLRSIAMPSVLDNSFPDSEQRQYGGEPTLDKVFLPSLELFEAEKRIADQRCEQVDEGPFLTRNLAGNAYAYQGIRYGSEELMAYPRERNRWGTFGGSGYSGINIKRAIKIRPALWVNLSDSLAGAHVHPRLRCNKQEFALDAKRLSDCHVGDAIHLGIISYRSYYGARVSSNIKWTIAENDGSKMLLVAYEPVDYRPLDGEGSADGVNCGLRSWVTVDFFNSLPERVRNCILAVMTNADDCIGHDNIPGNRVFLLRERELMRYESLPLKRPRFSKYLPRGRGVKVAAYAGYTESTLLSNKHSDGEMVSAMTLEWCFDENGNITQEAPSMRNSGLTGNDEYELRRDSLRSSAVRAVRPAFWIDYRLYDRLSTG